MLSPKNSIILHFTPRNATIDLIAKGCTTTIKMCLQYSVPITITLNIKKVLHLVGKRKNVILRSTDWNYHHPTRKALKPYHNRPVMNEPQNVDHTYHFVVNMLTAGLLDIVIKTEFVKKILPILQNYQPHIRACQFQSRHPWFKSWPGFLSPVGKQLLI